MRTKMKKILYIFSLIVGILLNASADVYKLKVTNKEQKIREKKIKLQKQSNFWVTDGIPRVDETQANNTNTMKFVAIDNSTQSIVNDWIDSGKIDDQKYRNPRKIYFKKGSGEVVIYLNGINLEDRRAVAKQQFENILKCGLLSKNIIRCNNKGYAHAKGENNLDRTTSFNSNIFENKFLQTLQRDKLLDSFVSYKNSTNEQEDIITQNPLGLSDRWQMPGIAVRVSHNKDENEFPVMCSMKISRPSKCNANDFFQKGDWKNLFSDTPPTKAFGNYEHTERQLFYSMVCGNTENVTQTQMKDNDTFFIWTKGNPCITQDNFPDNGGYCCAVWYKNIIKKLVGKNSKVFLYFNGNKPEVRFFDTKPPQDTDQLVKFSSKDGEHLQCSIIQKSSFCETERDEAIKILNTWSNGAKIEYVNLQATIVKQ